MMLRTLKNQQKHTERAKELCISPLQQTSLDIILCLFLFFAGSAWWHFKSDLAAGYLPFIYICPVSTGDRVQKLLSPCYEIMNHGNYFGNIIWSLKVMCLSLWWFYKWVKIRVNVSQRWPHKAIYAFALMSNNNSSSGMHPRSDPVKCLSPLTSPPLPQFILSSSLIHQLS